MGRASWLREGSARAVKASRPPTPSLRSWSRLRAREGVPTSSVPGFVERMDFEAESPSEVVERARAVLGVWELLPLG